MSSRQTVTFQEALDIVESLPQYQQEDLINIVRRRHRERKRELLAKRIREARAEYAKGEVNRGTAEDLMEELTESERSFGARPLSELSNVPSGSSRR